MTPRNGRPGELSELLEALCEERLTAPQAARLEELVLSDRAALRYYLDYIDLHGTLSWDTALACDGSTAETGGTLVETRRPGAITVPASAEPLASRAGTSRQSRLGVSMQTVHRVIAAVAAVCLVALLVWFGSRGDNPNVVPVANHNETPVTPPADRPERDPSAVNGSANSQLARTENRQPVHVPSVRHEPAVADRPPVSNSVGRSTDLPDAAGEESLPVVAFVDQQIRLGWDDAEIAPSPRAEDSEWIRRVYLDLLGHIPPVEAVESFLADRNPEKRARLVEQLLDDPKYIRHWSTVWSNLLVGRSNERSADRAGLQAFLREGFARNRPWNEMVAELVAAEGSPEENGASGFLLAHLNNEAVPATAITARLFLGMQVQCMQCHDHPFNDWKQAQFWELNSFFQQTAKVDRPQRDPRSGKTLMKAALVTEPVGGPIYYETRSGLMRAAFPKFSGEQVSPDATVNRREVLAKLLVEGDRPQIAAAMVNRLWEHFFGAGFTRPVDDMGPHNPPTHPAVLDRLSREFVASGYDVKQLIRWICSTEAYQRSSRFGERNEIDDPSIGHLPLFSRVYVKPMTAEQLYDSLLVATRAHEAGRSDWEAAERQRQEWLQQFVIAFETDENDEASTFDGTIPQALLMMNSDLVERAVSAERGTYLHEVVTDKGNDVEKIRRLCVAALSRYPTQREITAIRKVIRERTSRVPPGNAQLALAESYKDVFWALLNSNEFILVP